MKRLALAALAALSVAAPASAQVRENAKCTPNPVFEKFPNSVYHSCERSRFSRLELARAVDPAKLGGKSEKV